MIYEKIQEKKKEMQQLVVDRIPLDIAGDNATRELDRSITLRQEIQDAVEKRWYILLTASLVFICVLGIFLWLGVTLFKQGAQPLTALIISIIEVVILMIILRRRSSFEALLRLLWPQLYQKYVESNNANKSHELIAQHQAAWVEIFKNEAEMIIKQEEINALTQQLPALLKKNLNKINIYDVPYEEQEDLKRYLGEITDSSSS